MKNKNRVLSFFLSFLFILAFLIQTGVSFADNIYGEWTNGGVYGGRFDVITKIDETLYALSMVNGVYKSTNGGQNWLSIEDDFEDEIAYTDLIAVNNILILATDNGMYKSTNGGDGWEAYNNILSDQNIPRIFYVNNTLYAEADELLKSDDLGETWTVISDELPMFTNYLGMEYVDGKLFCATADGLFVSGNNGTNWTQVLNGIPAGTYFDQLKKFDGDFFACSDHKIYKSTDNGQNWQETSHGLPDEFYSNHLLKADNKLFLATNKGLFKSTDNGVNWGLENINATQAQSMVMISEDIYLATNQGVFKLKKGNSSWEQINSGLTNIEASCLEIYGSNIFAGTFNGIYVSNDDGISWKPSGKGMGDVQIYDVCTLNEVVFAATGDGIFKTNDNGQNWARAGFDGNWVFTLTIHGNDIFAGNNNGIFKSTDGGNSWVLKDNGTPHGYMCFKLRTFGDVIYSGTNEEALGILKSMDGGESWEDISFNIEPYAIDNDFLEIGEDLFTVDSPTGIFMLDKENEEWIDVNEDLPDKNVYAIEYIGGHIYVGTGKGVFRSDYSLVKTRMDKSKLASQTDLIGVQAGTSTNLKTPRAPSSQIFSWQPFNENLGSPQVTNLLLYKNDLFATTQVGIFGTKLSMAISGKVINSKTGEGLQAQVSLEKGGNSIGETIQSKPDGSFLYPTGFFPGNDYTASAQLSNFVGEPLDFSVGRVDTTGLEIKLTPLESELEPQPTEPEKPLPPNETDQNNLSYLESASSLNAGTSDENNFLFWLILIGLSGIVAAVLIVFKFKKQR